MTRKTFVYDQKLGKMVERTGNRPSSERKGPHIMGDIKPYRTVGPDYGRLITSRSQHRAYLKQYGLEEVGNEKKYCGPVDD